MTEPFSLLRRATDPIVRLALPPRCPACGVVTDDDDRFCLECWQQLEHLDGGCPQCGDPALAARDEGTLCAQCLIDPPAFDTMRAAVAYGDIARAIALRLKYGGRIGLARLIAKTMARRMRGLEDAILVPVPLHRGRIWRRGFNQAALIAKALAKDDADRVEFSALERTRATAYLRNMGAREREKAVRGAFKIQPDNRLRIKGQRIVLVDDVYTSGATTRACARLLKRHGASEVHVRCWARVARGEAPAY